MRGFTDPQIKRARKPYHTRQANTTTRPTTVGSPPSQADRQAETTELQQTLTQIAKMPTEASQAPAQLLNSA